MSLSRSRELVGQGQYSQALDAIWAALPAAQDRDDLFALAELHGLCEQIVRAGSAQQAGNARRVIASIVQLHPRVAEESQAQQGSLPVTTGTELPGRRVTEIIGPVFGLTVRSRDVVTQLGAKLKGGTVGGELPGMTSLMEQARAQALARLVERARGLGADGVIAMRFDVTDMAGVWTEIAAYGTAVRSEPIRSPQADPSQP